MKTSRLQWAIWQVVHFVATVGLLITPLAYGQKEPAPFVNVEVAAQMVEGGKTDKDRLFVFNFTYSPDGYCQVQSVTFNNLSCGKDKNSMRLPPSTGIWMKQEFCNRAFCGERFTCAVRRLDAQKVELTVKIPIDASGDITHRVVVEGGRRLVDYVGTLSKFSDLTKSLVSANYAAIRSKNLYTFQDIDIGCAKVAVPVLPNER